MKSRPKIKKLSAIRKVHSGVLRGTVWRTTGAHGENKTTVRNYPHSERLPKKNKIENTNAMKSRPKIKKLSAIRKVHSGVLRGTVCFRNRGTRRKRKGAVLKYCPLSFSSMTLLRNKQVPQAPATYWRDICTSASGSLQIPELRHPI